MIHRNDNHNLAHVQRQQQRHIRWRQQRRRRPSLQGTQVGVFLLRTGWPLLLPAARAARWSQSTAGMHCVCAQAPGVCCDPRARGALGARRLAFYGALHHKLRPKSTWTSTVARAWTVSRLCAETESFEPRRRGARTRLLQPFSPWLLPARRAGRGGLGLVCRIRAGHHAKGWAVEPCALLTCG